MTSKNNIKQKNLYIVFCLIFFIPVLILKNGNKWLDKYIGDTENIHKWIDHLDYPSLVFAIALIFPLAYFIYDFITRKNINVISILSFINILLTGGIGVFGSKLGLTKNWFILKEGLLPLVIGFSLFLMSIFKKESFYNIFLNELMFKKDKIINSIDDNLKSEFDRVLSNRILFYIWICNKLNDTIFSCFYDSRFEPRRDII